MPRKTKLSYKKNWERKRQAKKKAKDKSSPPIQAQSSDSSPAQAHSSDSSPSQAHFSDSSPAQAHSSDSSPAQVHLSDSSPAQAHSSDSSLAQAHSSYSTAQAHSSDSSPAQANSSDSFPAQAHSSDLSPAQAHSSDFSNQGCLSDSSLTCSSNSFIHSPETTLQDLHNSLMLPNRYWSDQSPSLLSSIRVCKLLSVASTSTQPLVITHCVTVNSDLQWTLFVYNHQVTPSSCRALKSIPSKLSKDSLYTLLHLVDQLHVCPGHPEKHFIEFVLSRKGVLKSHDGSISAILDDYAPVSLNGITYSCTIRTGKCEHLVHEVKCLSCQRYRSTLRSAYSRFMRRQPDRVSDTGSHVNIRYMTTPEKRCKMRKMMLRTQEAEQEIKKLRRKIAQLTYKHGEAVELDLHNELLNVMKQKTKDVLDAYPEGSFTRLFWEEQLRAAKASDPRQMRWHPLIVRWCLNLKLLSSAAYHAARTAGFIKLPSERTLRDYTHYFKHRPGFQQEVNQQLMKESKVHDLPEEQKYCGIIFDEMKVKENLVYDKYTGSVIGFINIGQINNDLLALEQEFKRDGAHAPIANHLLVLMVRGIFFKLEFPLAHFATTGVTADQLFPIIWEGVRQVESVGLKVLFITADGASANRKFFRMHRNSNDACMSNVPTYKTQNPFAQEQRPIFFISDPSHLMKTTRNCWSHSAFSGTRLMTKNGKFILWKHLDDLYKKLSDMAMQSNGLNLIPKLKMEHVHLTSYARMRVDLAVQVLSASVANGLQYFGDPQTKATETFIRLMDRFFDCMNVRSFSESHQKRKDDLKPYTSPEDSRLKWLECDFLHYFETWEGEINSSNHTPSEKRKMGLSDETVYGLRMTVLSFVEMTRYLLTLPGNENLSLLSERVSQDPLENYFGMQRTRGGRCDNPTIQQSLQNAVAIRAQHSLELDRVQGNSRRKRRLFDDFPKIDDTPLPKRKRS